MSLKKSFLKKKNQFYNYLTDPKLIRRCIIAAEIFFPAMIIMGVLVAVFLGPGNYNMMDNYISDMGSHRYTPIPKFLDDGVMITSILLVPVSFYLKKIFDLKSNQLETIKISPKYSSLVLISFLIGLFGIFGAGFFSEDIAISLYPHTTSAYDIHEIFTVVEFVGVASAGLFIGIIFVRFPQGIIEICGYEKMSKIVPIIMGLLMIFLTPIFCAFFLLELPPSTPFWEWMLFFSIFGWILPLGVAVLHQIKTEELI